MATDVRFSNGLLPGCDAAFRQLGCLLLQETSSSISSAPVLSGGLSTRHSSHSTVPAIKHTPQPSYSGHMVFSGHMTSSDDVIGCRTPVSGHKRSRRPHFVASPEPSPEGGYVGQHSQGIGGHYAESYLTKRRRKL